MRDIERGRNRQREKQAPCREPDVRLELDEGLEPDAVLDPGTLGSCSEPKEDAQPLSHPGIPHCIIGYMGKPKWSAFKHKPQDMVEELSSRQLEIRGWKLGYRVY